MEDRSPEILQTVPEIPNSKDLALSLLAWAKQALCPDEKRRPQTPAQHSDMGKGSL